MTLPVKLKGRLVRLDENGLVSLNDIYRASGFTKNKRPSEWRLLEVTKRLITEAVIQNQRENPRQKIRSSSVICSKTGDGLYVDPRLALAYAEYLSPSLALEVRDVFLRYKRGDVTLADEVLGKSSAEGNEWAAVRALGRAKRRRYTDTLQIHGVNGYGYAQCTDETYRHILSAPAKSLRQIRGLPPKANVRDHLDTDELVMVMAAEVLATGRIKEEGSQGTRECRVATGRSASFISEAMRRDKLDRKPRLI